MKINDVKFIKGIKGTDPILFDDIPQIAFVGRSNVGKSSLINSLLGKREVARTGKKPGKTREINFFKINNTFYLVDLPGYGYAKVAPAEKEKIRKMILWYLFHSGTKHKKIVLLTDAVVGLTSFDEDMLSLLRDNGKEYVLIVNKSDKLKARELEKRLEEIRKLGITEVFTHSINNKNDSVTILDKILSS